MRKCRHDEQLSWRDFNRFTYVYTEFRTGLTFCCDCESIAPKHSGEGAATSFELLLQILFNPLDPTFEVAESLDMNYDPT